MSFTRYSDSGNGKVLAVLGLTVLLAACVSGRGSPVPSVSPVVSRAAPVVSSSVLATPTGAQSRLDIGGRVLFHRRDKTGWFNVHVLNLATGEDLSLTREAGNNYDPMPSPSGDLIAFISDRNQEAPYGNLWLMGSDGSHQRALLEQGKYMDLGPTWSPDGKRIAFQSNRQVKNPDIFIVDVESGNVVNLTQHPNLDANPAWSPDGTQIAFVSDRSGNPEIWVVDVDGSNARQVSYRPRLGEWRPAWSPDGQALIFESFPTIAPRVLCIQALADTQAQVVETFSVWNMWPSWVKKDLILYSASEEYDDDTLEGSPANLYLQDLATGEVRQLTSGSTDDGRPTWIP